MKATFHGARGSIPIPEPDYVQVGGNTPGFRSLLITEELLYLTPIPGHSSMPIDIQSAQAVFSPTYNNSVAFKNTLYIPANWGYDCPKVLVTDSLLSVFS